MAGQALSAHLHQQLTGVGAPLCVALSGGGDSTALLHALASMDAVRQAGLRAVHVDHGLHPDSDSWAQRCRQLCAALDVPVSIHPVAVDSVGCGIEAAARQARYNALAAELAPGERLLTAHHADDQAETVLLKLMRGAGPHGLAGMRALRPLGSGVLWRPLLTLPRTVLRDYLDAHGLAAIDDPANADPALARSYVRHTIVPALQRHWPRAGRVLAQAAALQRDTADFIDLHVAEALSRLRAANASLDAAGWRRLHAGLRTPLLEQWLHAQHLPAPTAAQRMQLERQIVEAAPDRVPEVRWPGARVHLWRGRLHAEPAFADPPDDWQAAWESGTLDLPPGCGRLHWQTDTAPSGQTPPEPPVLQVRLGVRGVRLKPAGDRHTRELRDLFQQAAVPPWVRRRCPLLYADDGTLLAVADLWQTEAGRRLFGRTRCQPQWQRAC
jgi:tRNA(Ile)-lysidine synthase